MKMRNSGEYSNSFGIASLVLGIIGIVVNTIMIIFVVLDLAIFGL